MVRRPQSHRRKVLLPDGAQNFHHAGRGSTWSPSELVRVPGYRFTSSHVSLPAPYPAITLHAWRLSEVPTEAWLARQATLCAKASNWAPMARRVWCSPWVAASPGDLRIWESLKSFNRNESKLLGSSAPASEVCLARHLPMGSRYANFAI